MVKRANEMVITIGGGGSVVKGLTVRKGVGGVEMRSIDR